MEDRETRLAKLVAEVIAEWQQATGCKTPQEARQRFHGQTCPTCRVRIGAEYRDILQAVRTAIYQNVDIDTLLIPTSMYRILLGKLEDEAKANQDILSTDRFRFVQCETISYESLYWAKEICRLLQNDGRVPLLVTYY